MAFRGSLVESHEFREFGGRNWDLGKQLTESLATPSGRVPMDHGGRTLSRGCIPSYLLISSSICFRRRPFTLV